MNTNTGAIYPTKEAALADLKSGETAADVVEITGTPEALENISRAIQQMRAIEKRRAANKVAAAARRKNRR